MILNYKEFEEIFNKKLFENSSKKLFETIAKNPDRYVGLFRPTKPYTKIIQNITQSHEIRFGDAMEVLFEKYFEKSEYELLNKKIESSDNIYNIDQLFKIDKKIIFIEQKVRDDHDSTKKRGQFKNFEDKYSILEDIYEDYEIFSVMWFIDDSLSKNKNYYQEEINKMSKDYNANVKLCYGETLFLDLNFLNQNIWIEVLNYLETWKHSLPDMPEVNFDLSCDEKFEEVKTLTPSTFRKFFDDERIVEEILPILSPKKHFLNKLKNYFEAQKKPVYKNLAEKIEKISY